MLNSIASGLSVPTQSSAGIVANAAAPAASYVIGQEFKRRNAEGSLGHLLAHATLGGLTAAAGGNDPLAGALSSGGAEAAAGYISRLFGQTDGSRLSTEQKETVTAITGLIGTAAGAALGSTPADVAQGSLNAKNAVENNYYAGQQNFAVEQACNRRTPEQCREIQQAYSEARLLMGEKLLPVIDEAARFFIPPYDLVRSLAEAKNGREAIIAIVSALPPAKIFDRAKDLIHAGKELDALKELQRLKEYFSANPALATANGVKVPSPHVKPQSAPSSGGNIVPQTINQIQQQTGIKLIFDKSRTIWTTPAGLDYGLGSIHGNRIKHILAHAVPDPRKVTHSVFNVPRNKILPLIDEAWKMRRNPIPNDPGVYMINMGRVIGTKGETILRIVVKPNTNKIITAYPFKP